MPSPPPACVWCGLETAPPLSPLRGRRESSSPAPTHSSARKPSPNRKSISPPLYRFCTISFVTFVSFVTLAFSIHLLLRYLKRSPKTPSISPLKGENPKSPFKALSISPLKGENPKSPFKTLSGSPLKGEKSSLPLREGQGGSLDGVSEAGRV